MSRWLGPLAALAVVGGALAHDPHLFSRAIHRPQPSLIARLESRLAPLFAELPGDAKVGFVTDDHHNLRRILINYILAPRLFELGAKQPLTVGVFDQPIGPFLYDHHVRVKRDLGGGVYLLERAP
jgi:hypothetical protein